MYHTSPEDSREHITVDGYDAKGNHTKTIHVAKNKDEQQDYRDWTKSAAPVIGSMYSAPPSTSYATGSMYSAYSAPSTSHASSSQWANPMATSAGAVYASVATASYASPSYSTTPAATPSGHVSAWSEWEWSEEYNCKYRYRENPAVDGGYEYEYDESASTSRQSKHKSGKGKGNYRR
jgi:hypothetical protein